MSVPNQRTVIIHKPKKELFLMVGREDVLAVSKPLNKPCAIALYLYLACNNDGFPFELSQVAYTNATGFGRSSYYRAVDKLTECGYLYEDNCGRLNFATVPKVGLRTATQDWEEDSQGRNKNSQLGKEMMQSGEKVYSEVNREIK